jgi:rhodanese-related sulfurtransferase
MSRTSFSAVAAAFLRRRGFDVTYVNGEIARWYGAGEARS